MRHKEFILSFLVLLGVPNLSYANPVSFKDGWGIMPAYNGDWSDLQINYSITNHSSIGASSYYRDGEDERATFGIGQFNYLLSRWNEMESQANLYASVGAGGRNSSEHDDSLAGYGALEGDYETRRIYTLLSFESLQSPSDADFNRLRYRAGFAPYTAPFESLQTWVIFQLDYMPEMDQRSRITPLLRFFLNNYALELGVSLDGEPYLGAMAHF